MNPLITILGPTATGKTTLAANLASLIGGEIISADSRQVYRGMDIGTGKDLKDYIVNEQSISCHLVDITDPGSRYNVFEYLMDFSEAFSKIIMAENIPILCGGSGMYLDAVLRGYKLGKVPENSELREKLNELDNNKLIARLKSYGSLHNISDVSDNERLLRAIEIADFQKKHTDMSIKLPKFNALNFGVFFERHILRARITERLEARLNEGMIAEVETLLNDGVKADELLYYGLEYKFVTMYVGGELTYDQMFEKLNIAIHQFAKRQMTWYRRMEKKGVKIHWIDGNIDLGDKIAVILSRINF